MINVSKEKFIKTTKQHKLQLNGYASLSYKQYQYFYCKNCRLEFTVLKKENPFNNIEKNFYLQEELACNEYIIKQIL